MLLAAGVAIDLAGQGQHRPMHHAPMPSDAAKRIGSAASRATVLEMKHRGDSQVMPMAASTLGTPYALHPGAREGVRNVMSDTGKSVPGPPVFVRRAPLVSAAVAGSIFAISVVHFVTPAGPHEFHWVHLLAQKLYVIPILVAAAWWGVRSTLITTAIVSVIFGVHIAKDWAGYQMVQADQIADIINLWIVALVSALLFQRIRRFVDEVHQAHQETLTALAASLDLREHGTGRHSQRVRDYSLLLADRLGIAGDREREDLAIGALLHDVGKIGIPDRILLKETGHSEEEFREIKRHPDLGASLIGGIGSLQVAADLVRCHHEKYDGTGYPRGLAGETIPAGARVFAVADSFDAMTTDRPYRRALGFREVVDLITRDRGTHFDPAVVDAFLGIPFREWARVASRHDTVLIEE